MDQILITTLFTAKVSLAQTIDCASLIFGAISVFLFILNWDHKCQEWNLTAVKHNYNQNFLCVPGRSSRKNQKWRGPDENIRANLRQYGTEKMYLDVMVSDASKPVWKKGPLFDAIITDRRFCQHLAYANHLHHL